MSYKFLSDAHIHSDNSHNAKDPPSKICEQASRLGLYSITITDTCDCVTYSEYTSRRAIRQSFFQIKKAQNTFSEYINVFTGIELTQPTRNKQAAEDALSIVDFDFVLAKIDRPSNGQESFSQINYINENVNYILDRYFEEIVDLINWGKFDSLSQLTEPLQLMTSTPGVSIDMDNISQKMGIILEKLAKNNKALEIDNNMLCNHASDSALFIYNILHTFKKAGGQHITFGSDAYSYENVGNGVPNCLEAADKVGFTHFSLFKSRAPHLLPIT